MKTISPTSYNTYQNCPYLWKLTYVLKLKQLDNDNFTIGKNYHKALELYYRGNTKEQIEEMFKGDELLLCMFHKYLEYPLEGNIINLEEKFTIENETTEAQLTGIIDRLDEDKIVDYKTTSKDYKEEELNNFQTDLYIYVRWLETGKLYPMVYHVMNKKKCHQKKYEPQVLTYTRTEEQMQEMKSILQKFEILIEGQSFDPNPGQTCYFCPFGNKGTKNCQYSK